MPEPPFCWHGSCHPGDVLSLLLCDRASCRRHSQPLPIKGNSGEKKKKNNSSRDLLWILPVTVLGDKQYMKRDQLMPRWTSKSAGQPRWNPALSAHSRSVFTERGVKGTPPAPAADSWELRACTERRAQQRAGPYRAVSQP